MGGISRRRIKPRITIPGARGECPGSAQKGCHRPSPATGCVSPSSSAVMPRPFAGWNWCSPRCAWRCGNATEPTTRVPAVKYTAVEFTDNVAVQEIAPQVCSVGDAYDNALTESIVDVGLATMPPVQCHNNRRSHFTLRMLPPAEYKRPTGLGALQSLSPVKAATPI